MKARYIGNYYKVMFEQGEIYEVVSVEDGYYKIYSDAFEDWGLFAQNEFKLIDKEQGSQDMDRWKRDASENLTARLDGKRAFYSRYEESSAQTIPR